MLDATCDFNSTGRHFIMKGVYLTIWTELFEASELGVVVQSLGIQDNVIYIFWIFIFWDAMKSLLYDSPINSEMDLVARISSLLP